MNCMFQIIRNIYLIVHNNYNVLWLMKKTKEGYVTGGNVGALMNVFTEY